MEDTLIMFVRCAPLKSFEAAIDATSERAVSVINAWWVFLSGNFDLFMRMFIMMLSHSLGS